MNLFDHLCVFSANHQTHHFILIGIADPYFTGFASTTHHDHPVRNSKNILHIATNQDDRNAPIAKSPYHLNHFELLRYTQCSRCILHHPNTTSPVPTHPNDNTPRLPPYYP